MVFRVDEFKQSGLYLLFPGESGSFSPAKKSKPSHTFSNLIWTRFPLKSEPRRPSRPARCVLKRSRQILPRLASDAGFFR